MKKLSIVKLFQKKNLIKIIIAILIPGIVILIFLSFPRAEILKPNELGVVSFISSLPDNETKEVAALKAKDAGFGWFREEYTYDDPIDYKPYTAAYKKFYGAGLNILGLLTYPGPKVTHREWQNYVKEVVAKYPGVKAWEIMNEVDNDLSGADYAAYLKEASTVIKSKSTAPVICSGVSPTAQAYQFWQDLKENGGWEACDILGLHLYHNGDPEIDNGGGTLAQEMNAAVDNLKLLGSDKRIWVTEFGYDAKKTGEKKQSNWLIKGLGILQEYPEIERIFVYRLYDENDHYGLLNNDLSVKESFGAIKDWLVSGSPVLAKITKDNPADPNAVKSTEIAKPIDKDKSLIQIQEEIVLAEDQPAFQVSVTTRDTDGKIVTDQKPSILLSGGQTEVADFALVGETWQTKVKSDEKGERKAQIIAKETDLGMVKMVFGVTDIPAPSETLPVVTSPPVVPPVVSTPPPVVTAKPTTVTTPVATPETTGHSKTGLLWFILIESIILSLIVFVVYKLWQRSQTVN